MSTTGPGRSQASTSPESRMASVRATRSSMSMPRKNTAIAKAATWPSVMVSAVRPSTMKRICSGDSLRAVALGGDHLLGEHQ